MAFDAARAKSLFLAASELSDAAERGTYLDRECGGDADLRARVEALLRADLAPGLAPAGADATGTFPSDEPSTGTFAPDALSAPAPTSDYPGRDEHAGAVIGGKYTLVEVIGEGGMGSVWRAKQTEPVKRFVAVKLIKAGMDSKQVLARFEAERQALALMDHPNIAKVLDGGLHGHRPFFVMELVKGVPITDYCDHRKLTPQQRLELFVPVCQAIQHAHQKGIIHRDIKPSNVLIALYDDIPVVKVIDFGVAKATGGALTEHTIDTGFGGVVGTPQYMSPEQATFNNLDIDTRSDVYTLGVLLYELLTGSPPFSKNDLEKRGLLEMLRVVREEEPLRPSTKISTAAALPTLSANRGTEPKKLTGLLRNELDWIVMKALEKDRTRRYESANGFAADVVRYLSGEAILAHPPSHSYRLKKFIRRNKGQVVAAGLVMFALLAGVAGTTLGMIRADRARTDESTQRGIAEENERLAKAAERAATQASEQAKASEAHAKSALDNADKLLGIQEWFSRGSERRYTPEQLATLQGLAAQFEAVANGGPGPDAAEAFNRLASVQILLAKLPERDKSLERSVQLWSDLIRTDPANANEHRVQVAKVRARQLAVVTSKYPPDPKQLVLTRLVAADWKAVTDADPTNTEAFSERAAVLHSMAYLVCPSVPYPETPPPEKLAEKAAIDREALACLEKAVELRPGDQALWRKLLSFHGDVHGSPSTVRLALRAATRFPDQTLPRRFKMPRESDYPYARDRETFDSDLCVQVISGRVDPAFKEWKANPAWRPEETFRHLIAEPCREILKEFPGYKYASGIEFLLKLREARAAEWVLETPTKVGEPTKPVPLTAEQRRRAAALYREALELARKPETKLPTEFLTLTLREKDFYEHVQRPQKSVPMTAEEYVWFHRLGSIWGVPDGALDELQREVLARKDWRPTPMFLHRVLMATLPDDIIHSPDTPKETLIAHWMQADALFARIKAGVPRDSEDYRKVTDRFSATAIHIAGRFRAMGERGLAKQAMTRCIQFIEETPVRPDVQDWPYRTRCYFDRGNLHFDGGEWAAALADYQTCLKLSKQKPGEYDSLSIPGMNAVAQFRSGTALLRLNRFDEAERAFDEALQIRGAEMFESRPLKSGKPSVPWLVPVTEHDRANEYKLVGRWESAEKWAGRALKTLAENEDAYPVEQVNRYRFRLHSIRAQALDNLKDHEAAAKAWDVAREYGTAEELRLYAVLSAAAYAQVGRHEEVARRLEELAASGKLSAIEAYNAGCGFALCSIGAKVDKDLAAKYRNRAMEMLKKAVASGYANAEEMKADPDLIPLRDRADFKALVAELEKKF